MTKDDAPIVFVIDDDSAIRRAMRLVLEAGGFTVVAHATADEFLHEYAPDQPGCLLLDVHMPGMSGIELQHQLNLRGAIVPVIFMTGQGDVPTAVEAMQHGAFDFLQKPFRDVDLVTRVQRALDKDRTTREHLRHTDRIRSRIAALSPREREVLGLMMLGKLNKVMAGDLGVSQRTLELHRARVMEKMEAGSLAELVRMAIDAGVPRETAG